MFESCSSGKRLLSFSADCDSRPVVSDCRLMSRSLIIDPASQHPPAPGLVAVDRALAELRRGAVIGLTGADSPLLLLAAEAATPEILATLPSGRAAPHLVITGRRAFALGLTGADAYSDLPALLVAADRSLDLRLIQEICDPLSPGCAETVHLTAWPAPAWGAAAVAIVKLARLLPAVIAVPVAALAGELVTVSMAAIQCYPEHAAHSLRQVAEARVPLADAPETRIVAFRPADGGIEHLALIIGAPDRDEPVLARLHSECFTGDLLGSLRCDCGEQLRGAIAEIAATGGGVLLYLAQEGRGIGLVNKLRAYGLQDDGFDTIDANRQLGFDDDERLYAPAAEMLHQLGIQAVRLMTNNPAKLEGLARHGIRVEARVPHIFPSNDHNAAYLRTKAEKAGHLL